MPRIFEGERNTSFGTSGEWSTRRARFNHDWLRVSFLTFLQAWREELDRAGETGQISDDLRGTLKEWEYRQSELAFLIAEAEQTLSPARGVEQPPLNRLPIERREWLRQVAHALWLDQSGVSSLMVDLTTAKKDVDAMVSALVSGERVPGAGSKLYEQCGRVSQLLASLPAVRSDR